MYLGILAVSSKCLYHGGDFLYQYSLNMSLYGKMNILIAIMIAIAVIQSVGGLFGLLGLLTKNTFSIRMYKFCMVNLVLINGLIMAVLG